MKPLLFFMCAAFTIQLQAQNRANIWELSYTYDYVTPKCELKYSNNLMDTTSIDRVMSFFITDGSICDTNGNLLFYSNGLVVGNRNYDTLQNSVNFNPGGLSDFNEPDGLSACQGLLIIPDPGNEKRYYLFHESGEFMVVQNTLQAQPLHLSFSVVDMNLDNGLGGIVDSLKNVEILEDTLAWGGLTAVKHANGRDWWIIFHHFFSDKYFKLLVTPDGIQGPFEQKIGSTLMYDAFVESTFSPDGSKFCFSNYGGWFDYMEFDRCTGIFYNPITVFSPDSMGFYGCSFSPSNQFLYVSSQRNLYQYNVLEPNLSQNAIHIAEWDSFYDPATGIAVLFNMHQSAPDSRIYLSGFNGTIYLNVINVPDSLGTLCDFEPHSFVLPYHTFTTAIPQFPYYDLGSLQGSDCDTLYLGTADNKILTRSSFSISPNPASEWLNIVYQSSEDVLFELYNVNGQRVAAASLYHYFRNRPINVSDLPAGVYFCSITEKGKQVWSEKVVVGR